MTSIRKALRSGINLLSALIDGKRTNDEKETEENNTELTQNQDFKEQLESYVQFLYKDKDSTEKEKKQIKNSTSFMKQQLNNYAKELQLTYHPQKQEFCLKETKIDVATAFAIINVYSSLKNEKRREDEQSKNSEELDEQRVLKKETINYLIEKFENELETELTKERTIKLFEKKEIRTNSYQRIKLKTNALDNLIKEIKYYAQLHTGFKEKGTVQQNRELLNKEINIMRTYTMNPVRFPTKQ